MKVPSSSRRRSGLAWASCSSSRRAGSILGVTVIVVSFFESVFADHSKDHAVAVAVSTATRSPRAVHHSAGLHWRRSDVRPRAGETFTERLSREPLLSDTNWALPASVL